MKLFGLLPIPIVGKLQTDKERADHKSERYAINKMINKKIEEQVGEIRKENVRLQYEVNADSVLIKTLQESVKNLSNIHMKASVNNNLNN